MNAGCWLRHTNSVEAPLATAGAALSLSSVGGAATLDWSGWNSWKYLENQELQTFTRRIRNQILGVETLRTSISIIGIVKRLHMLVFS